MNLLEVLLAQQLGGGGSGGGVTPEQLANYVKDNAIKNVESTPSTDSYIVGNVIFDKSDGKIKLCGLNTSDVKVWTDIVEVWLQAYQEKITAGAGLVFDGNTLKHSNSVTPKPQRYIRATAYDAQGHAINFGVDYLVSRSDYNDDAVSDLYLTSSMWVHVHHSPIEASSFASEVNNSISANDCVFNMMDIGGATRTRRSQKRYMGLASITDPISNTALYGGIDVTEYWYA